MWRNSAMHSVPAHCVSMCKFPRFLRNKLLHFSSFSLLALATSAKELNLVCPELSPKEKDVLYIEEGRFEFYFCLKENERVAFRCFFRASWISLTIKIAYVF